MHTLTPLGRFIFSNYIWSCPKFLSSFIIFGQMLVGWGLSILIIKEFILKLSFMDQLEERKKDTTNSLICTTFSQEFNGWFSPQGNDSEGAKTFRDLIRSLLFFSVSHKEYGYLMGSSNDFFCVLNERTHFISVGIPVLFFIALLELISEVWHLETFKQKNSCMSMHHCFIYHTESIYFMRIISTHWLQVTKEHHAVIFSYCYLRYIRIIE